MDWSTLLATVVGGVLAVGGSFLAQLRSERHAIQREDREREQERHVWARNLRHEAHLLFLTTYDELRKRYEVAEERVREGVARGETPNDFMVPLWDRLSMVRLVSEKATTAKAQLAAQALMDHVFSTTPWEAVSESLDQYIGAVREEFKLGPIELMGD